MPGTGFRRFLRFVGFGYAVAGVVGLAGLSLPGTNLVEIVGVTSPLLLVTPLPLTIPYGIQAACDGQPRGPWGCNLQTEEIQSARSVLAVLCVASILGGLLGVWGASARNRAGRPVWFGLAALSIVVALWNVLFLFQSSFNGMMGVPSLFWAAAYANACFRLYRTSQPDESPVTSVEGG